MAGTGWQRTWVRILTTALTLTLMIMIFDFSTQTADQSDHTSGFISNAIIPMLYPNFNSESPERKQEIYDSVQFVVRKCAHFSEYTLLGFMIILCLQSWFGHRTKRRNILFLTALAIGVIYAGTDEWHQMLIDGRSGQWSDVLLDSSGVLFGSFLGNRLICLIDRKETK